MLKKWYIHTETGECLTSGIHIPRLVSVNKWYIHTETGECLTGGI